MAQDEEAAAEWLLGTEEEVRDYLYSISSERLSRLMGNAGIRIVYLFLVIPIFPVKKWEAIQRKSARRQCNGQLNMEAKCMDTLIQKHLQSEWQKIIIPIL